ncbi:rCG33979 [Rattus norvegicus]|uniref:RCG33979 n=1 Tax=Rattus norvegicus TaxID=10116 RepID=A6HFF5_RAT|nr:rCG33979 [Rattus norvegicus]
MYSLSPIYRKVTILEISLIINALISPVICTRLALRVPMLDKKVRDSCWAGAHCLLHYCCCGTQNSASSGVPWFHSNSVVGCTHFHTFLGESCSIHLFNSWDLNLCHSKAWQDCKIGTEVFPEECKTVCSFSRQG